MPSETFNIPDPAFLLSTYNEQVRTQQVAMHKWQIKFAFKVARQDVDFKKSLLRICLVANNGSGKSTFGVAPAAVWLGMRYAQGNIVITSASGKQLDNQTGRAVRHLCEQISR